MPTAGSHNHPASGCDDTIYHIYHIVWDSLSIMNRRLVRSQGYRACLNSLSSRKRVAAGTRVNLDTAGIKAGFAPCSDIQEIPAGNKSRDTSTDVGMRCCTPPTPLPTNKITTEASQQHRDSSGTCGPIRPLRVHVRVVCGCDRRHADSPTNEHGLPLMLNKTQKSVQQYHAKMAGVVLAYNPSPHGAGGDC